MKEKLNTCIAVYYYDGEYYTTRFCVITPEGKHLITGNIWGGDSLKRGWSEYTAEYQTPSYENVEVEFSFKNSDIPNKDKLYAVEEFVLRQVVNKELDVENIIFVCIDEDVYEGV